MQRRTLTRRNGVGSGCRVHMRPEVEFERSGNERGKIPTQYVGREGLVIYEDQQRPRRPICNRDPVIKLKSGFEARARWIAMVNRDFISRRRT